MRVFLPSEPSKQMPPYVFPYDINPMVLYEYVSDSDTSFYPYMRRSLSRCPCGVSAEAFLFYLELDVYAAVLCNTHLHGFNISLIKLFSFKVSHVDTSSFEGSVKHFVDI